MEGDGETMLLKLQEAGSGPGGATAGNVDSGELFGLAGLFSSDLRAAFDRVSSQLAVLDSTTGLDSISVLTSPRWRNRSSVLWRSWWRVRSPLQKL